MSDNYERVTMVERFISENVSTRVGFNDEGKVVVDMAFGGNEAQVVQSFDTDTLELENNSLDTNQDPDFFAEIAEEILGEEFDEEYGYHARVLEDVGYVLGQEVNEDAEKYLRATTDFADKISVEVVESSSEPVEVGDNVVHVFVPILSINDEEVAVWLDIDKYSNGVEQRYELSTDAEAITIENLEVNTEFHDVVKNAIEARGDIDGVGTYQAVSTFIEDEVTPVLEKALDDYQQKYRVSYTDAEIEGVEHSYVDLSIDRDDAVHEIASILTSGDTNSATYKAVAQAVEEHDSLQIEGIQYTSDEGFSVKEGQDFREVRRNFLEATGNQNLSRQIQREMEKGRSYEGPSLG